MRSRIDWRIAAVLWWLMAAPALPQVAQPAAPTREEITAAVEKVKADPNLNPERRVHFLRWVSSGESRPHQTPSWILWFIGLFRWLAESARVLMWVAAAVLASVLALYLIRLARGWRAGRAAPQFVAPSHVGELDIRPESLPDDIGGAAQALWQKGEQRAALALLYRGLLSRLVHAHAVPIRHSSTEGDCLTLAARHLDTARNAYASQLIRVWQQAVYGGQIPLDASITALCEGFAAALDPPLAAAQTGRAA